MIDLEYDIQQSLAYVGLVAGGEPIVPPLAGWDFQNLIALAGACQVTAWRGERSRLRATEHKEWAEAKADALDYALTAIVARSGGVTAKALAARIISRATTIRTTIKWRIDDNGDVLWQDEGGVWKRVDEE